MRAAPLALLLALAGCDALDSRPSVPLVPASQALLAEIVPDADPDDYPRDGLRITGVVNADTLAGTDVLVVRESVVRVDVEYGGGCAEHTFALLAGASFMESSPVQLQTWLLHDADGDSCDALIGDRLTLDLSPIRDAYRAAYPGGPNVVIVRLDEPGGGTTLRYEFE